MSQSNTTVAIITESISGQGENLYVVSSVQLEESDVTVELWRGDSEDHVLDQVYEHMMERDEVEEEEISDAFSFEVKFVGKVS
jgi:hypothetical protein